MADGGLNLEGATSTVIYIGAAIAHNRVHQDAKKSEGGLETSGIDSSRPLRERFQRVSGLSDCGISLTVS
jgi:hypothetical protein